MIENAGESKPDIVAGERLATKLYSFRNATEGELDLDAAQEITESFGDSDVGLDGRGLGRALYGLQAFSPDTLPPDLPAVLLEKMRASSPTMEQKDTTNGLHGLLAIKDMPGVLEIKEYLIGQLADIGPGDIDMRHVPFLYYVLKSWDAEIPEWLQELYERGYSYTTGPDNQTRRVMAELRKRHGGDIKTGVRIDGVELDILLPELNVNIELDGPQHTTHRVRDRQRDRFLEERHGIRVIRINLMGTSAKDAIAGLEL